MQYVRPGKARVKIDGKGMIVYAHNIKQEGEGFKKTYQNSSGFKKTYAPANSFNKQNYAPQYEKSNIHDTKIKVFSKLKSIEFEKIYNEWDKGKIFASKEIPTPFTYEDEKGDRNIYYDYIIYYYPNNK